MPPKNKQYTKRPENSIMYIERNLKESESENESDSGKSELDEEYYKMQPPPIPIDVLRANTVRLDGTLLNGEKFVPKSKEKFISKNSFEATLPKCKAPVGPSAASNMNENTTAEPKHDQEQIWEKRKIEVKIKRNFGYRETAMVKDVPPVEIIPDANQSCCRFLCDSIKSCCVIL